MGLEEVSCNSKGIGVFSESIKEKCLFTGYPQFSNILYHTSCWNLVAAYKRKRNCESFKSWITAQLAFALFDPKRKPLGNTTIAKNVILNVMFVQPPLVPKVLFENSVYFENLRVAISYN